MIYRRGAIRLYEESFFLKRCGNKASPHCHAYGDVIGARHESYGEDDRLSPGKLPVSPA